MKSARPLPRSDRAMDKAFQQFDPYDDQAILLQAAILMQQALDLLDAAGETHAAIHLQHAIDTLAKRRGQTH
jgi:hypothetical protein